MTNKAITPSSTHFISLEGADYYKIPKHKTRDLKGKPVEYAAFQGSYYEMRRTIKPFSKPIPFLN